MRRESEYGLEEQALFGDAGKSVFVPGKRYKINIIPLFLNVFVPWAFFAWIYHLMSFKFHYLHDHGPFKDYAPYYAMAICAVPVLIMAGLAVVNHKSYVPVWYKFNTLQTIAASWAGIYYGDQNYYKHMQAFYYWETLKVYPMVDPSKELGQNLMDAGTVYWAVNTGVDSSLGWHFKSDQQWGGVHRYCVAPITAGPPSTGSYDFWAVGLDCCSASSADFRCSGPGRSSLRNLNDLNRGLFKLAVKQAEAVHGIKAKHPLFFDFEPDPLAKVGSWKAGGGGWYLLGLATFFVANLTAVAIMTFVFSWIGRA